MSKGGGGSKGGKGAKLAVTSFGTPLYVEDSTNFEKIAPTPSLLSFTAQFLMLKYAAHSAIMFGTNTAQGTYFMLCVKMRSLVQGATPAATTVTLRLWPTASVRFHLRKPRLQHTAEESHNGSQIAHWCGGNFPASSRSSSTVQRMCLASAFRTLQAVRPRPLHDSAHCALPACLLPCAVREEAAWHTAH